MNLKRWRWRDLLPRIERGEAWCGRYVTVIAPRVLSVWMGRGVSGLWLYHWRERP